MNILGNSYLTTRRYFEPFVPSKKEPDQQNLLAEQFLTEWRAGKNIDGDQLLSDMLSFASRTVPFYSKHFSRNPEKDARRLSNWPILTRDDLWNEVASLHSTKTNPWKSWTHASGGSTGKPVSVVHDEYFAAKAQALRDFCGEIFLRGPHYNKLILWGVSGEGEKRAPSQGVFRWVKDEIRELLGIKATHINTFEFTREKFEQCVSILRHQKPQFILGYAGSVYELAKYLNEKGVQPPYVPRMIATTAQTLHPFMRELIEKVFRCRVCDHYGSREVGPLAWQHESGAMYFPKFFSKIEVVDEAGKPVSVGETGRILVTTLHNHTMPLIRYDIGDIGVRGGDVTYRGYPFATLESISGRCSEEFTNPRGSRICGPFFINLFYYRSWLDQFYIVQRDYDLIEIMYVAKQPHKEVPAQEQTQIDAKIKSVMTESCNIIWTRVDEIPTTKSGKRLFIRSEV